MRSRTKVVISSLMALNVAIAMAAYAQTDGTVSLSDGEVIFLDDEGAETARLSHSSWLAGSPAGNTRYGYLGVYDRAGIEVFSANAEASIVSALEQLYVRRASGVSTVRLEGAFGNLDAGGDGQDGDLFLKNNAFTNTIHLDGQTGNARTSLSGNGFVKGWARIDRAGGVLSCYNCEETTTGLNNGAPLGGVFYFVDFSPIADDITSRPRTLTIDKHGQTVLQDQRIGLHFIDDDPDDPSRIRVYFARKDDASSALSPFTIIVY